MTFRTCPITFAKVPLVTRVKRSEWSVATTSVLFSHTWRNAPALGLWLFARYPFQLLGPALSDAACTINLVSALPLGGWYRTGVECVKDDLPPSLALPIGKTRPPFIAEI